MNRRLSASRRVLQTVYGVETRLDFAGGHPGAELLEGLAVAGAEIEHDETFHARPVDQQRQVVDRSRHRFGGVVSGDRAADRHPGAAVQVAQAVVEDLAADVVEIDVDAFAAGRLELLREIGRLVVDRHVEAELFGQHPAFFGAAGDPDHPAAVDLGDLADHRADRAGRRRHHHLLAVLERADLEQAEIGGEAGHAERAKEKLGRQPRGSFSTPWPRLVAHFCQPKVPETRSPTANSGCREAATSPIARPRITSPILIGSM